MNTKALFVGHGTPMNAIEDNRYTDTWKSLGEKISGHTPPRHPRGLRALVHPRHRCDRHDQPQDHP